MHNLRYYGIRRKIVYEKLLYQYARLIAKVKTFIPGRKGEGYKTQFKSTYYTDFGMHGYNNALPDNYFFKLERIVTSDLIFREDIGKLQSGLRKMILKYKAGGDRFLPTLSDSLQDLSDKIDKMDSTLLSWYDGLDCGIFDFRDKKLCEAADYFKIFVRNINSSFLSLEFDIHICEKKRKELDQLIASDYKEPRGYINRMLISRSKGGARGVYVISHYTDDVLKADKIYEWISCVEWEFYNAIREYFPFVLHKQNIIPPRMEVYYTDIDYQDDNYYFWNSIGVADYQGQFIDERQKMFFDTRCSGRYSHADLSSRLMYIIKDDEIEAGQFKSVKDEVNYHIEWYANNYFKFIFLKIIARQAGKNVVRFKHKLDKIKLRKNKLKDILKLRYEFEKHIDPYVRYSKNEIWDRSLQVLEKEVFNKSDEFMKGVKKPVVITYKNFANDALAGAKEIDSTISAIRKDFDDKERILQHLIDYRDSKKNWWLNIVMMIISLITLIFIIFPDKAEWIADIIRNLFNR